jgi:molybdenum cofactor synthesis domain-containing protein
MDAAPTLHSLTAAILIIGNEILSGRTRDTNLNYIASELGEQGIDLKEVRVVEDDEAAIIEAVNALRIKYTYVFTTGGIGFTHDDITAACIAKAFGQPLVYHPKIESCIHAHYHGAMTVAGKRMALVPQHVSGLIENPVSHIPSFYIGNVYVLAGMPSVMRGMFQSLKHTLAKGRRVQSVSLRSALVESTIAHDLEAIQNHFPAVAIGSYPFYNPPRDIGTVLVARSRDEVALGEAVDALTQMIKGFGGEPTVE